MLTLIREKYRGTLIAAGGFDLDTAEAWLEQGKADLIAFGRKFIANPTSTFCEADSFHINEIGLLLVTIGLGPCVFGADDLR